MVEQSNNNEFKIESYLMLNFSQNANIKNPKRLLVDEQLAQMMCLMQPF